MEGIKYIHFYSISNWSAGINANSDPVPVVFLNTGNSPFPSILLSVMVLGGPSRDPASPSIDVFGTLTLAHVWKLSEGL